MKKPPSSKKKLDHVQPVEPSRCKPKTFPVEINKKLALYKNTGNALAAWAALLVCLRHKQPVPDGISPFFTEIAETLLQYATEGRKEARKLVDDLVLGTRNQAGGPSVFQQYQQALEEERLYDLIRSRMMKDVVEKYPPSTQTEVYEKVAEAEGREVDYIRKLFERMERDLDTFSIRALVKAKMQGGVAEL